MERIKPKRRRDPVGILPNMSGHHHLSSSIATRLEYLSKEHGLAAEDVVSQALDLWEAARSENACGDRQREDMGLAASEGSGPACVLGGHCVGESGEQPDGCGPKPHQDPWNCLPDCVDELIFQRLGRTRDAANARLVSKAWAITVMRSLPELLLWEYKGRDRYATAGKALPGIILATPNVKRLTLKCPVDEDKHEIPPGERLMTSINSLDKLQELRLVVSHGQAPGGSARSDNILRGLKPTFSRLTRLHIAFNKAFRNNDEGLAAAVGAMRSLTDLDIRLDYDPMDESSPTWVSALPPSLQSLSLTAVNFAGGGLEPLCSLPALSSLSILKCCFQRPQPMRLGSLTALKRLDFHQQYQLPLHQDMSELLLLTGLEHLHLHRSLRVKVIFDEYITEMARTLTNLVSLGLCCVNETTTDAAVTAIATNLSKLTSLELIADLFGPTQITGEGLRCLGVLTKLKHLGIGRLSVPPRHLIPLLNKLSSLRSLSLTCMDLEEDTWSKSPEDVKLLVGHYTQLEELDLEESVQFNFEYPTHMFNTEKERLAILSHNDQSFTAAMRSIGSLQNLTRLNLKGNIGISPISLSPLTALKRLKEVLVPLRPHEDQDLEGKHQWIRDTVSRLETLTEAAPVLAQMKQETHPDVNWNSALKSAFDCEQHLLYQHDSAAKPFLEIASLCGKVHNRWSEVAGHDPHDRS